VIPKDCKRLAEVDFPIAEVSRHAVREKSIRHGHPSTLHLWWARRPLASSRAVLLALLWPDPCDPLCPSEFKAKAREMLPQVLGKIGPGDEDLRQALLKFIADFANWDNAAQRTYLEVSRALVKTAHGEEAPLVVDPFAGGGSIPLEALRLGCDAFASDLNPVACLILKVMLEDIPRHGPKLAEELRRVGAEIKKQAERELADLYPEDPDGATPIAYLWARTVRCESPNCGAEIPLARSLWLCKKANRRRALKYRVVRPDAEPPRVEFEVFEPKVEKDVRGGTVRRAKATCVACSAVLPPERVRAQLTSQRGGADVIFDAEGCRRGGARLLAVVTLRPGEEGRHYRLPTDRDYQVVHNAHAKLAAFLSEWERGGKPSLCPVPDEPLPPIGTLGFRVQRYGMFRWGDLFTTRQKLALTSIQQCVRDVGDPGLIRALLGTNLNHVVERNSALCRWRPEDYMETVEGVFGRQALPPVWDFAEACPLSESTGSWNHCLEGAYAVAHYLARTLDAPGRTELSDARNVPLPDSAGRLGTLCLPSLQVPH
jgi:adenine-specific DNA methylase